ncbi:hypothetical protein KAFR_0A01740 [Kazachstania africana CBS 2517]|uniref:Protein kinase domain-containing protein n=1 Tax=Kazachstania africana (strain ATCC 22294 / BCRC 22015 / CBS 2517 / CECT 1963 / NBRC 1671 / NRRL Y-8276) TaxID=1071382 RepID=H2AML2_KAZAF|nr:hypothetical protein KAFR_0A01740 [Kazachstania africana CBS 2517]CCF55612.1 hypothetical protein KAFR_0A01740 [Kazachstania africana CBS 2517]
MSLVPYNNDSVILNDPASGSLVVVNPSVGSLTFYRRVASPRIMNVNNGRNSHNHSNQQSPSNSNNEISSYVCPQCGTIVDEGAFNTNSDSAFLAPHYRSSDINLSKKYFKLLESSHRQEQERVLSDNVSRSASIPESIPEDLFIPGYFHRFFEILSILGHGARGSVFKVVHKIGNTNLGIFAMKKISIGNDMQWFDKCIREVKALSSLTHKSANLITYNHVWLEMDTSYGVTNRNDMNSDKIPCLFILQQYCEGGNLEDCILIDVFNKFPEKVSTEDRKKRFRQLRKQKQIGHTQLGLSTKQILLIIRDIARGLHELHDIGIIHRDLKPSNCLLLTKYTASESNGQAKNDGMQGEFDQNEKSFPTIVIGDLGESQIAGETRSATGCTGTLEFTAPEVIITDNLENWNSKNLHYNEYTFASDMYSLGMLCYFITFGNLPFSSEVDLTELKYDVKNFRINKNTMIRKHNEMNLRPVDSRIFGIIQSLLNTEPSSRPTATIIEKKVTSILQEMEEQNHIEEKISPVNKADFIDGDSHFFDTVFGHDNLGEEHTVVTASNSMALALSKETKPHRKLRGSHLLQSVAKHSRSHLYSICSAILVTILLKYFEVNIMAKYALLIGLGFSFRSPSEDTKKIAFAFLAITLAKLCNIH